MQESSTGYLSADDLEANADFKAARDLLLRGDLDDREARQLRKLEREALDRLLADRRSWCPTCLNVLHNCHCADRLAARVRVSEAGVQLIHRLRMQDVVEREGRARAERLERRAAYRRAKKNRKAGN